MSLWTPKTGLKHHALVDGELRELHHGDAFEPTKGELANFRDKLEPFVEPKPVKKAEAKKPEPAKKPASNEKKA